MAPPGYATDKLLYIIRQWYKNPKTKAHASIEDGLVADEMVKNVIRLLGDRDGSKWPFLNGPLSSEAALDALTQILDNLPLEQQQKFETLHPRDKTALLQIGTGSSEPSAVQLWKIINGLGDNVLSKARPAANV